MAKLNQMLAVRKGLRDRTARAVTDIYHALQKPVLYMGLSRTYQPREDEGEQLPGERQIVQRSVEKDLQASAVALTRLVDAVATVDVANMTATAPVRLGGEVVIDPLPVATLLFLEKQLIDWRTQVSKVPVLDPEKVWTADPNVGGYRAEPVVTTRARKIPTVLTLAPATDKHPAQTQVYQRDEIVGDWTLTIFSGAVTNERRAALVLHVDELIDAVKSAVEEANAIEVVQVEVGARLFDELLP